MAVTFYSASGSPYAWRVWLALEHKHAAYEAKQLSFDAGDLKTPAYSAINPRNRVPALVDDGFALYESAAIVDYIEERFAGPSLYPSDLHGRATARRMIREADQYFAAAMEHLVERVLFTPQPQWSPDAIAAARSELQAEYAFWEERAEGLFLLGEVSAADYTLYPMLALVRRIGARVEGFDAAALAGPNLTAWLARMDALPIVQRTWPPHWR
ncbi:MAG: glutathione S-transferase family protein [Hyphomonadaceae bacterium]